MLIYTLVNSAFSGFASLKNPLLIQIQKVVCYLTCINPFRGEASSRMAIKTSIVNATSDDPP